MWAKTVRIKYLLIPSTQEKELIATAWNVWKMTETSCRQNIPQYESHCMKKNPNIWKQNWDYFRELNTNNHEGVCTKRKTHRQQQTKQLRHSESLDSGVSPPTTDMNTQYWRALVSPPVCRATLHPISEATEPVSHILTQTHTSSHILTHPHTCPSQPPHATRRMLLSVCCSLGPPRVSLRDPLPFVQSWKGIAALPNCPTIIALHVLWSLCQSFNSYCHSLWNPLCPGPRGRFPLSLRLWTPTCRDPGLRLGYAEASLTLHQTETLFCLFSHWE